VEVRERETPSQEVRRLNRNVDSRNVGTVDSGWTKTDTEDFHFSVSVLGQSISKFKNCGATNNANRELKAEYV